MPYEQVFDLIKVHLIASGPTIPMVPSSIKELYQKYKIDGYPNSTIKEALNSEPTTSDYPKRNSYTIIGENMLMLKAIQKLAHNATIITDKVVGTVRCLYIRIIDNFR